MMSEDCKSIKANSEDSKSDTADPILCDSQNREEDAGNDTMSKDSNSDTSEATAEDKKKNTILLEFLQVLKNECAETEHYPAGFLKQGLIQGISYQLKLLTWTAWNLFKNKENNNWELAAEVRDARGFHDLVLKYNMKTDSKTEESTSKYRFMQIKHTSSKHPIDKNHLSSKEAFDRQYSLVYLFTAYLDMLQSFKDDQIIDLTLFTNKSIYKFPFLVLIREEDTISGFKKKGQRYRVDIKAINSNSKIMKCLKKIKDDDVCIKNFLNKLIFAVNQPTESELEELIVNDMEKNLGFMGPIFYTYLFKNIFDWFLLYDVQQKTSSYYTKDHIVGLFETYHRALGKVVDAAIRNPLFSCLLF